MTDIPLRAIAELKRRRQQQLQIAEAADHSTQRTHAEGKADGYGTAIDVLKAMRSGE